MSHTALAFYRKSQSLTSLDFERPKSLDTVRQVASEQVQRVEQRLELLSREFYSGRTPEEEIRELLPYVHDVMIRHQVSHINSSTIIVEAMERSTDKEEMRDGYPNPIVVVSNYNKKINAFCPGRFDDLLADLRRVLECLHKYCRSYYKGTVQDPFIETAQHYELKRLDYAAAARRQMDDIVGLSDAYRSEDGVSKSQFGLVVNELARRCDCGSLPFLLVFPECCQRIKSACAVVRRWLQEDSEYVDYIRKDIVDLEHRKELQARLVRDSQQRRVQLNHKLKSLKRDVADLIDQLEKVKEREASVEADIKRMEDEIKFTEMDIEAKEGEKEALRKNAGTIFDHAEVNERCERLSREIAKLRAHIPNVRRQIENVISGRKFIVQKRELLAQKREHVAQVGAVAAEAHNACVRQEAELTRVEVCLAQLRDIFLYRTTPDMMKKIFYNMPTEARRVRLKPIQGPVTAAKFSKAKPKKDLIDRAVGLVAHELQSEWPKLYRRLPFYPPRGHATIEDDLDEIIKDQYRGKPEAQARASLARWRRMHSRANIGELQAALRQMNRPDVASKLESLISSSEAPTTGPPRTFLPPAPGAAAADATGRSAPEADVLDDSKRPKSKIGVGIKYKQVKAAAQKFMAMRGPYRYQARGRGGFSETDAAEGGLLEMDA